MAEEEIILQVLGVGNSLKVIAVCAKTGLEVSFIAPKGTSMLSLKMMAQKKMAYVKNKKNQS